MASSRDVLNAFRMHVTKILDTGDVDAARAAWKDFVGNVVPSFPAEHRSEALAAYEAFERERDERQ